MRRIRVFFATFLMIISLSAIILSLVMSDFTRTSAVDARAVTPTLTGGAQLNVDFGLRQNQSHPIPSGIFGANAANVFAVSNQADPYLQQANFKLMRIFTEFDQIFTTPASLTDPTKRNWTWFNQQMTYIQQQGLTPIISLDYSPTWMQPQNQNPQSVNYCLVSKDPRAHQFPSHVLPTYIVNGQDIGLQTWGQLAALVVQHTDQNFPGIKPYYEIWNEPDGSHFLCTANSDPNPLQTQLNWYMSIYQHSAPQIQAQAQADNTTAITGGPALAFPRFHATMWMPAFVNNAAIAPYIDFISYHQYFGSVTDTWDSGSTTLLHAMQKLPMSIVQGPEYISSVVRTGLQPNAHSTPILIDEYNTFTGVSGCCRYSPTYGPLWTSLFVADILNTVNDKNSQYGPASNVPYLVYYAMSDQPNGFCLFGNTLTQDCATNANIGPYSPYYAMQLLGDSSFLDITNNAYVANSATTNAPGIVVTGFYTSTLNNILVVNTGSQDYQQFDLRATNPTKLNTNAILYTLNQANPTIGRQQVTLTPTSYGYHVTVDVPPYSTVALSMSI